MIALGLRNLRRAWLASACHSTKLVYVKSFDSYTTKNSRAPSRTFTASFATFILAIELHHCASVETVFVVEKPY